MSVTTERTSNRSRGDRLVIEPDPQTRVPLQQVFATPSLADADLVVISHLRWDWVWQRPQHLISRIGAGRRTWFVEEPRHADVQRPRLHTEDVGPVMRVWLEVPPDT